MNGPAPTSPETSFALRRLISFAPVEADEQVLLQRAAGSARAIPARREILSQGAPIRQPLILIDGWACHAHMLSDGRRQILHVLLPGDVLGMSSHSDPTAPTTIIALSNVLLCPAPAPPVQQAEHGLTEAYARSRAQDEIYLLRHIIRLGRLSAPERIMDWLLEIGERLAFAGLGTPDLFPFPVTQEVIADILGLTSVHVNRTIQSMRREGYLQIKGGTVSILDRERCVRLAEYPQIASAAPTGISR
jgi:CRP-like cAMP-binding protein